jgi:hypothetical protein
LYVFGELRRKNGRMVVGQNRTKVRHTIKQGDHKNSVASQVEYLQLAKFKIATMSRSMYTYIMFVL